MRKELKAINNQIKPLAEECSELMANIYTHFKSQSAYKKNGKQVPWTYVCTTLKHYQPCAGNWGTYTGYCEAVLGKCLLTEKERIENEIAKLNRERDTILEPYRLRLSQARYVRKLAEYNNRMETYKNELSEWENRLIEWEEQKREWEIRQPTEILPVKAVEPSDVDAVSDLGMLAPQWGANKGRNSSWRFFFTGDTTKTGKLQLFVERPQPFPVSKPSEPWEPQEPPKPNSVGI